MANEIRPTSNGGNNYYKFDGNIGAGKKIGSFYNSKINSSNFFTLINTANTFKINPSSANVSVYNTINLNPLSSQYLEQQKVIEKYLTDNDAQLTDKEKETLNNWIDVLDKKITLSNVVYGSIYSETEKNDALFELYYFDAFEIINISGLEAFEKEIETIKAELNETDDPELHRKLFAYTLFLENKAMYEKRSDPEFQALVKKGKDLSLLYDDHGNCTLSTYEEITDEVIAKVKENIDAKEGDCNFFGIDTTTGWMYEECMTSYEQEYFFYLLATEGKKAAIEYIHSLKNKVEDQTVYKIVENRQYFWDTAEGLEKINLGIFWGIGDGAKAATRNLPGIDRENVDMRVGVATSKMIENSEDDLAKYAYMAAAGTTENVLVTGTLAPIATISLPALTATVGGITSYNDSVDDQYYSQDGNVNHAIALLNGVGGAAEGYMTGKIVNNGFKFLANPKGITSSVINYISKNGLRKTALQILKADTKTFGFWLDAAFTTGSTVIEGYSQYQTSGEVDYLGLTLKGVGTFGAARLTDKLAADNISDIFGKGVINYKDKLYNVSTPEKINEFLNSLPDGERMVYSRVFRQQVWGKNVTFNEQITSIFDTSVRDAIRDVSGIDVDWDLRRSEYIEDVIDYNVKWDVDKQVSASLKTNFEEVGINFDKLDDGLKNKLTNCESFEFDIDGVKYKSEDFYSGIDRDKWTNAAMVKYTKKAIAVYDEVQYRIIDGVLGGELADSNINMYLSNTVVTDTKKIMTPEAYKNWKSIFNPDGNDMCEVVVLQQSQKGANGMVSYGGNLGGKQGAFVMPKSEYDKLLKNPEIFDQTTGKIINKTELSNALGAVPISDNMIAISTKVHIDDIKIPDASHPNAYFGDFIPGGRNVATQEGIIPQLNYFIDNGINIDIINGDQTVYDVVNLMNKSGSAFGKIEATGFVD